MKATVIKIEDQQLEYFIRESQRAERTRIAVDSGGRVIITKPNKQTIETIEHFIKQKYQWILDKQHSYMKSAKIMPDLARTDRYHFHLHRADCVELMKSKVAQWNQILNYPVGNIYVKQMSSRWGSCAPSNNISFNYKLLFLPDDIQNYVVVHELCHTKVKNHSRKFWDLVASIMPDYPEVKAKIKHL